MAEELSNLNIKGSFTTSNKESSNKKYKTDRKTAYINILKEDFKKIKDFGLTIYEPESEEKTTPDKFKEGQFLIVKCVESIPVYLDGVIVEEKSGLRKEDGLKVPTFSTAKDENENSALVDLSILKGYTEDDDRYFRLQAIQVNSIDDIVDNKQVNPFA